MMESAVLWQNDAETVFLIDIPTSIERAQTSKAESWPFRLVSRAPLTEAFAVAEARSPEAQQRLERSQSLTVSVDLLEAAVAEIRAAHIGSWCLDRVVRDIIEEGETKTMLPPAVGWSQNAPVRLVTKEHDVRHHADLLQRVVRNGLDSRVLIPVHESGTGYLIPSAAAFFMSKVTADAALQLSIAAAQDEGVKGEFDLIIMDPPWPNRSVRRGRQYQTADDPFDALQIVLPTLMSSRTVVACWVTNKAAVRKSVLAAFEYWDVDLVEEWIWIKTTIQGQYVVPLTSLWKRPYEVLLIGRHSASTEKVVRRCFVAVPDLHSRKPNLQKHLQSLLRCPESCRTLEIFARNLSAETWAWGDQCLKFAETAAWTPCHEA